MQLKPETLEDIDARIARYPQPRSAVLMLLHAVQEDQGYLSAESIRWVAEKLGIEPGQVYELVTFYPMLRQMPVGRQHFKVCRTLSCALRGSAQVCEQLQKELGCATLGRPEANGQFSVEFVECLAACHLAPVVQVNEGLPEQVQPKAVAQWVGLKKTQVGQKEG